MKKKSIIITALILGVIAAYFIYNRSKDCCVDTKSYQETSDVSVEFEDEKAERLKVANDDSTASSTSENEQAPKLAVTSDEELDKLLEQKEEIFDEIEETWLEDVKGIFTENEVPEHKYQEYLKMRDGLFQDKIRAFEDMHEALEEKYGENYTYNPTEEELVFEKKIQKKYDDLLLELIGEQAFIKYLELRDRTNQEIQERTDISDTAIVMEF